MSSFKTSDSSVGLSKINLRALFDKRVFIAVAYVLFGCVQALTTLRASATFNLNTLILYGLAFYFYYQKRDSLRFADNTAAQVLGAGLILLPSFKLLTLYGVDAHGFWAIVPPIFMLGLVLLADGFHGIKQFWRLLFGIVFISGLFSRIQWLLQSYANLNLLSAKFSAYFLWVIGFDAISDGTIVYVNDGAIDIHTPCTVFPMLFACVELWVIVWLFFPKAVPNLLLGLMVSFLITFPLSIVRLAIMALVVNNPADFNFWHGTDGSNIFMSTSLISFATFILISKG